MSNFYCEKCGALCADSEKGYTSGCEHYPPDIKDEFDSEDTTVKRNHELMLLSLKFVNGDKNG